MTADEITCRELVELVTDYLEDALDTPTLEVFEQHLVLCDGCETYVEQMRTTIAALEDAPVGSFGEPAPEPSEKVLAALRARRRGSSG